MTPQKKGVATNIGKNFAETLQFEDLSDTPTRSMRIEAPKENPFLGIFFWGGTYGRTYASTDRCNDGWTEGRGEGGLTCHLSTYHLSSVSAGNVVEPSSIVCVCVCKRRGGGGGDVRTYKKLLITKLC